MKRLILLSAVIALLLNYPCYSADLIIKGKLLGQSGETMKLAHIHYQIAHEWKMYEADIDGSFMIKIPEQPYISLQATGVNHSIYEFGIVTEDRTNDTVELDIKLSQNSLPKNIDKIYITGSFNNFSFDDGLIEMTKPDSNTYSANVDWKQDTLFYQVIIVEGRSIDGSMSDFFVYDGGGDYRSALLKKKGGYKIIFDLNTLSKVRSQPVIIFNDSKIEFSFNNIKRGNDLNQNYLMEWSKIYSTYRKSDSLDEKWNKAAILYMDSISALINNTKPGYMRNLILLTYFQIATRVANDELKLEINKDYAKEIINNVKPQSEIWDRKSYLIIPILNVLEDFPDSKYLNDFLEKNPSETTKAWTLLEAIRYSFQEFKDSITGYKFYERLIKEYPNSDAARAAKIEFSKDKKIVKGNLLPEFKFENIDSPGEFITNTSLKGKFVLLDFWGTWCGPCIMEMPYLDSAYAKFKDMNFIILSIAFDPSKWVVNNFRSKKWKMPWLHALEPEQFKSKSAETFEIRGVPRPILIDPEGKIIALEGELRHEELKKTLEKYLQ